MKVKVLQPDTIVKGIDVSAAYYASLSNLLHYLGKPEDLVDIKRSDPKRYEEIIAPLLIFFQTVDQKADEQGLTEEMEASELGLESPAV